MIDYLAIAKEAEARFNGEDGPPQAHADALGVAPAPASSSGAVIERLLRLRLDQFESDGAPLEVHVPWWPSPHFFVPTARDVEALRRQGIGRERIWLPAELAQLVDARVSTEDIRARTVVTLVLRTFDGEVTEVLRPPRWNAVPNEPGR